MVEAMRSSAADAAAAAASAGTLLDALIQELRRRGDKADGTVDRHQVACFDLALTAADAAAAGAVAELEGDDSLLRDLGVLFTDQAARSAAHRLAPHLRDHELTAAVRAPLLSADDEAAIGLRLLEHGPRFTDRLVSGELAMLRDTYRRFSRQVVAPRAEAIHRQDLLVPDEILDGLRELGCFGLSIPEEHGGLRRGEEGDTLAMLLATEELSRGSLGAAGSLITRPEVVARAILAGGTATQKARWLPLLASGEALCAVAVTEPDAGSDVAAMRLRARPDEDGGGWRLDGSKMWSTFAGRAEVLMVLARTDPDPGAGHRGLSLFLVEKPPYEGHDFAFEQDGGGSLRGRAIATLGYRGMHSYELFFDGYRVPDEALVGGEAGLGRGFYMTMAGFAGGRIQTAARATGLMQAALEEAMELARGRSVFGRPLADYQLTRVKLARMAAHLLAARALAYRTAPLMDRRGGDMEAALAKLFASRAAEWVTREAVQMHGGMGYAEETAVSRYFADAKVLPIFEGTEEVLALKVIARALLAG